MAEFVGRIQLDLLDTNVIAEGIFMDHFANQKELRVRISHTTTPAHRQHHTTAPHHRTTPPHHHHTTRPHHRTTPPHLHLFRFLEVDEEDEIDFELGQQIAVLWRNEGIREIVSCSSRGQNLFQLLCNKLVSGHKTPPNLTLNWEKTQRRLIHQVVTFQIIDVDMLSDCHVWRCSRNARLFPG
jgi:hypothetical protein